MAGMTSVSTSAAAGPPHSEPADPPHLLRSDPRVVEYQTPIAEEDESTETASEPAEPVTPTSHSSENAPFSNPFRHDDAVDGVFTTPAPAKAPRPLVQDLPGKPLPSSAPPSREAPAPPGSVSRTSSNLKMQAQQEHIISPPEKPGLGRRVGSFVRNKLHRTPSAKDGASHANGQSERTRNGQIDRSKNGQAGEVKTDKLIVKTGVDGPAEVSSPAINIPRYGRRLSSFSLSGRNTPKSSHTNSPPSPSSLNSTVSNEQEQGKPLKGHKHSTSSTALSSMSKKGPGITWANNGRGSKKSTWHRRRSASTEQVPRMDADEEEKPTAGMLATFSKPAAEGVGMKARRLSLSLPDEFVVDSCDLDKEFKSSSLMPGKRGKCLGKGATAEVRIMARKGFSAEELVAVKEFRSREKGESDDDYVKKIKSEFSIAKSLHHPNVVETVRLCTNRGRWNHVMEFCSHGELFSLVERKLFAGSTEGYYSADDRLCFFKQLLRGVDYLHSHGIAHRDIKLENLLLNRDGHLKISDFGVAEVFSGEHPGLRAAGGECGKNMGEVRLSAPGICGSLPYIAPEVLEKKCSYDPRPLDIWSCAIVYLTMTFGGCPWQAAKTEFEYYARFKKGWDDWLQEHPDGQIVDGPDGHPKCGKLFSLITPPPIKRLVLKMLHPIPEKRITIREVLESPCVKNINCCCPENYEDPKCCVDAAKGKKTGPVVVTKKYLHHHIPPKPESKFGKAFTHRFDMGDGY